MTKEERREYRREYLRKWKAEHREKLREKHNSRLRECRAERREEYNTRVRERRAEHKEELNARMRERRSKRREEFNARMKIKRAEDMNSNGVTKSYIRVESGRILDKCHAKLSGYEIHHCFGYEDPSKFIYIPRELHIKIHQLLRDKKIPADSDHWHLIRELVNSCEEYTYIRT